MCMSVYISILVSFFFFFFQAEDGIRDKLVTGVQTCALPIFRWPMTRGGYDQDYGPSAKDAAKLAEARQAGLSFSFEDDAVIWKLGKPADRSEERRVGKECRSRWSPYH